MRQNKQKKNNSKAIMPFIISSQELQNIHNSQQKTLPQSQLETIENIYSYISAETTDAHEHENVSIEDCFAVQLACIIMEHIESLDVCYDNGFTDEFYHACLKKALQSDCCYECEDEDVIIIYIKQCVQILKTAQLISIKNNKASISRKDISTEVLFYKLYNSFWNLTPWEDIFPSDEDAARELKNNRIILIDIVLNHYKRVKLDTLANDFFDLTGFSVKNDLVMISFLDFYFFTWLKHFGIISYKGSVQSPVYIEITKKGRRFLSHI